MARGCFWKPHSAGEAGRCISAPATASFFLRREPLRRGRDHERPSGNLPGMSSSQGRQHLRMRITSMWTRRLVVPRLRLAQCFNAGEAYVDKNEHKFEDHGGNSDGPTLSEANSASDGKGTRTDEHLI